MPNEFRSKKIQKLKLLLEILRIQSVKNLRTITIKITREEKLYKISATKTVLSGEFEEIIPNEKNDWINQRGNEFEKYILLGDKKIIVKKYS